jgi:phosphatidylglycerophosphate synthase
MTIHAVIFAETPVQLWGLSSRQRLERILKKMNILNWLDDPAAASSSDTILLLRGDYLYDERLIRGLSKKTATVLVADDRPVAAHVWADEAARVRALLDGSANAAEFPALRFETPQTLGINHQLTLRKVDVPYLLPITLENQRRLEQRLFSGSYKGVTDLVTKWLWPRPAQVVTRFCARNGITPNQVTSLSLVLVLIAGLFFYKGAFALGLLAAWGMTFLDTVDGKLARVTVNSSQFGNIFDHAIDLISPPLWYLVWGVGLTTWEPGFDLSLKVAFGLIFSAYIAGRIVEGVFKQFLESSGIFCWRPFDSYFRLITGRRNPNLILLTLGLAAGRPDLGLVAVTAWTVVSSIILVVRLLTGLCMHLSGTPLRSWLLDVDPTTPTPSLTQRCFTTTTHD